jgi:hypothetical protein
MKGCGGELDATGQPQLDSHNLRQRVAGVRTTGRDAFMMYAVKSKSRKMAVHCRPRSGVPETLPDAW